MSGKKSGKSQGILKLRICGNPVRLTIFQNKKKKNDGQVSTGNGYPAHLLQNFQKHLWLEKLSNIENV